MPPPFNGSGIYAGPASSWNPAVDTVVINSTDWNALLADVTTALSTGLLKDGTQTATAVIPFALGLKSASTIGVGNQAPAASGAGISFPAAQSASTDANTLDDYEEQNWTVGDGSGAGLTITNNSQATAVKIGQMVFAEFDITYPATADGTNALLNGLPYVSKTTDAGWGVMIAFQNVAAGFAGRVSANAQAMSFNTTGTVQTNASLSGKTIRGVAIYRAAA